VNFVFTVGKTQSTYAGNTALAGTLYVIHLYFMVLTLVILFEIVCDFTAKGVEERRLFGTDQLSGSVRELYGLFPPMTLALILSLILLFILHIITMLILMGVIDGTQTGYSSLYDYGSMGMAVFYLVVVLLQYSTRQQRIMRLARDIEFGHSLAGFLFFVSAGGTYAVFTFNNVPSTYVANPLLAAELNSLYFYFLVGTLVLIITSLFNMPAKGNEERRLANVVPDST